MLYKGKYLKFYILRYCLLLLFREGTILQRTLPETFWRRSRLSLTVINLQVSIRVTHLRFFFFYLLPPTSLTFPKTIKQRYQFFIKIRRRETQTTYLCKHLSFKFSGNCKLFKSTKLSVVQFVCYCETKVTRSILT